MTDDRPDEVPDAEAPDAGVPDAAGPDTAVPPPALTQAVASPTPPPFDPALEGATEVFAAQPVGLPDPPNESAPASAIDSLFGDHQFRDYVAEPMIGPPAFAARAVSPPADGAPAAQKPPRSPLPMNQKILLWAAAVLGGALALVGLFLIGTRLPDLFGPAAAVSPSPTPSASPTPEALALGPAPPGEYTWDELLGGECLEPYESPWVEDFTVVDCTSPHAAQMVYRGVFVDEAQVVYPGVEELQKRINLLCTPPTIINYAVAGTVSDVQVAASFAADEQEWDAGHRSYFCFVNRLSGEPLTADVAMPQVAPAAPLPAP